MCCNSIVSGEKLLVYKMERVKSMLVGFGFLGFVLLLKTVYGGENMVILSMLLILLVLGPTLVAYKGKIYFNKAVKT